MSAYRCPESQQRWMEGKRLISSFLSHLVIVELARLTIPLMNCFIAFQFVLISLEACVCVRLRAHQTVLTCCLPSRGHLLQLSNDIFGCSVVAAGLMQCCGSGARLTNGLQNSDEMSRFDTRAFGWTTLICKIQIAAPSLFLPHLILTSLGIEMFCWLNPSRQMEGYGTRSGAARTDERILSKCVLQQK